MEGISTQDTLKWINSLNLNETQPQSQPEENQNIPQEQPSTESISDPLQETQDFIDSINQDLSPDPTKEAGTPEWFKKRQSERALKKDPFYEKAVDRYINTGNIAQWANDTWNSVKDIPEVVESGANQAAAGIEKLAVKAIDLPGEVGQSLLNLVTGKKVQPFTVGRDLGVNKYLDESIKASQGVIDKSHMPELGKKYFQAAGSIIPDLMTLQPAISQLEKIPAIGKWAGSVAMGIWGALKGLSDDDLGKALTGAASGLAMGRISEITKPIHNSILKGVAEGLGFASVSELETSIQKGEIANPTDPEVLSSFLLGMGLSGGGVKLSKKDAEKIAEMKKIEEATVQKRIKEIEEKQNNPEIQQPVEEITPQEPSVYNPPKYDPLNVKLEYQPGKSSRFKEYAYDPNSKTFGIIDKKGEEVLFTMEPSRYQEFLEAPSKGKNFNEFLVEQKGKPRNPNRIKNELKLTPAEIMLKGGPDVAAEKYGVGNFDPDKFASKDSYYYTGDGPKIENILDRKKIYEPVEYKDNIGAEGYAWSITRKIGHSVKNGPITFEIDKPLLDKYYRSEGIPDKPDIKMSTDPMFSEIFPKSSDLTEERVLGSLPMSYKGNNLVKRAIFRLDPKEDMDSVVKGTGKTYGDFFNDLTDKGIKVDVVKGDHLFTVETALKEGKPVPKQSIEPYGKEMQDRVDSLEKIIPTPEMKEAVRSFDFIDALQSTAFRELNPTDRTDRQILSTLAKMWKDNPGDFFDLRNEKIGKMNLAKLQTNVIVSQFKQTISDVMGEKRGVFSKETFYGNQARRMDKVLKVVRNIESYKGDARDLLSSNKLSPEKKALLKEALDIYSGNSKYSKQFASLLEKVKISYDRLAKVRDDMGILSPVEVKNFDPLDWGGPFKVSHKMEKQFDSMLDGWAVGKDLKVEGMTESFKDYALQTWAEVTFKDFVDTGKTMRAVIDGEGSVGPLFTTNPRTEAIIEEGGNVPPGINAINVRIGDDGSKYHVFSGKYKKIESEWFSQYVKVRKLTSQEVVNLPKIEKTIGKNSLIANNTLYEKQDLYAPAHIADYLNRMYAPVKQKSFVGKWFDNISQFYKKSKLYLGMFHPFAAARNYYLGMSGFLSGDTPLSMRNAYHQGLNMMKGLEPTIQFLVSKGMTLGEMGDFYQNMQPKKGGLMGKLKEKSGVERYEFWMFQKLFQGLKAKSGAIVLRRLMEKYPTMDIEKLGTIAADFANSMYGGMPIEQMGISPTQRLWMQRIMLAPDWDLSNVSAITKAIPRSYAIYEKRVGKGKDSGAWVSVDPIEAKIYRKAWGNVLMRGTIAVTLVDLIMSIWDDTPIGKRIREISKYNPMRALFANITPIAKQFGTDKRARSLNIFGHWLDPVKWIEPMFGYFSSKKTAKQVDSIDIMQPIKNKASMGLRIIIDLLTGQDWKGEKFTGYRELAKTGKLTKFSVGKAFLPATSIPSFILSEAVGVLPIFADKMFQYADGQIEGFDWIMQSLGTGEYVKYKRRHR